MTHRGLAIAVTALAVAVPVALASAAPGPARIGRGSVTCAPGPKADCSGVSAPGVQLRGRNLKGMNLTGANLRNADLTKANLTGATLVRANLAGAKLDGANFSKARILGSTITGTSAVHSTWVGATFGRAARPGTRLKVAASSFVSTTVSGNHCGANFNGAEIEYSTFSGDFSYATCGTAATFVGTVQQHSFFSRANLTGVDLTGTSATLTNYIGAQLTGTNWQSATGSEDDFTAAVFGTDSRGTVNVFFFTSILDCTCPNGMNGSFSDGPCGMPPPPPPTFSS